MYIKFTRFHRTRCGIGYLVYAHLVAALELHIELFITRPVAAHAVRFVFCDARPRLFVGGDGDVSYLQGISVGRQVVACGGEGFVLRAGRQKDGGEQEV